MLYYTPSSQLCNALLPFKNRRTMRGLPLLVVATFSMAVPAPRRAGLTYGPNVVQLTASNLKDKVDDGTCSGCTGETGKVFLVDFYAAW
jgi:hypothetical protein